MSEDKIKELKDEFRYITKFDTHYEDMQKGFEQFINNYIDKNAKEITFITKNDAHFAREIAKCVLDVISTDPWAIAHRHDVALGVKSTNAHIDGEYYTLNFIECSSFIFPETLKYLKNHKQGFVVII